MLRSIKDILPQADLAQLDEAIASLPGGGQLGIAIGGSLIEGYGTSDSDIDIYVFCNELPHTRDFPIGMFLELDDSEGRTATPLGMPVSTVYQTFRKSRFHADIKFVPIESLQLLFRDVLRNYDLSVENDTIFYLNFRDLPDYEDRMLFHRLGYAEYRDPSLRLLGLLERRPVDEFLLTQFRRRSLSFPKIRDIRGAISSEQGLMAHEIARALARDQLMALVHLRGCSNPNEKWLHVEAVRHAPREWGMLRATMADSLRDGEEVIRCLEYLDVCEHFLDRIRAESALPRWHSHFKRAEAIYRSGLKQRQRLGDAAPVDASDVMMKNFTATCRTLREIVTSA